MKKAVLSLLLVFAAGIVFGQTIVVTPFNTRGQTLTRDDAASITELFIAELADGKGVRVVDRTSLARVVREMQFQNTDWSNPQKTAQLGAALNAEFMVRGQLNQLGQQISVAITALDIKTLEVVSSDTRTFDVNRIFDNTARGDYYPYENISIFGVMPKMASGIASPIKTRITQAAQTAERQRQEAEGRSFLVGGTWIARGGDGIGTYGQRANYSEVNISNPRNSMEIIFYNDGSLYITVEQSWAFGFDYGEPNITRMTSRGGGNYTLVGNRLNITWDSETTGITYRGEKTRTGSGRNATTTQRWIPRNINERDRHTFSVEIEFSQNGRSMTWDKKGYREIPSLFWKQ